VVLSALEKKMILQLMREANKKAVCLDYKLNQDVFEKKLKVRSENLKKRV